MTEILAIRRRHLEDATVRGSWLLVYRGQESVHPDAESAFEKLMELAKGAEIDPADVYIGLLDAADTEAAAPVLTGTIFRA